LGSDASDEGGLSDHEDEESITNEGEPDILLEGGDDRGRGEPEQIEGE
jgi:hypothetical protein